jgi:hypothetical protein
MRTTMEFVHKPDRTGHRDRQECELLAAPDPGGSTPIVWTGDGMFPRGSYALVSWSTLEPVEAAERHPELSNAALDRLQSGRPLRKPRTKTVNLKR